MKYWLLLAQWIGLATVLSAPPQKPEPSRTPPPSGNRYLFVVETSAAMTRFEHDGRQAVFDLLFSGVQGRMRRGDTYGVWTFNEDLYAGQYPMQIWQGHHSALDHASNVGRFLKAQKYERTGNLGKAIQAIQGVGRAARDVNVFIVSEGISPVTGTPFDAQINAAFGSNMLKQVELRKPLITTLTIRNGEFTAAAVTSAGEAIELADLPKRPGESDAMAATSPVSTNNPAVSPQPKPLGQILSIANVDEAKPVTTNAAIYMRNTNTKPAVVENAIVESTNAAVPVPVVEVASTNEPVKAEPSPSAVPVAATTSTPTNIASVTRTIPPATVIAAPVMANEPSPKGPEPLPSVVPALVQAQAREINPGAGTGAPPSGNNLVLMLMLTVGGALVGGALVFALFWVRRWRATPQTSFISRGMDRY